MGFFFLFSIHPSHPFRHLFFFLPSFLSSFLTILLSFLPSPPSFHPSFFSYFVASLGPSFVPSSLLPSLFPFFLSFPNSLLLFLRKSLIHFFVYLFINSYKTSLSPISLVNRWTASKNSQTLLVSWNVWKGLATPSANITLTKWPSANMTLRKWPSTEKWPSAKKYPSADATRELKLSFFSREVQWTRMRLVNAIVNLLFGSFYIWIF